MQKPALGATDSLVDTIARFRTNLETYAKLCLKIRDKNSRIKPFEFNEAQRIVHTKLGEQLQATGMVRAIVLKARQEGVSTYVAARNFRSIHLWPGIVAMVIADKLIRAEALYDIYERYHANLPPEIAPRVQNVGHRRFLKFTHDSELSVRMSSDKEAGRATTIHRIHASELAYWEAGAAETWRSLMEAVPDTPGTEVIVESTANGAGGLFHEMWVRAEEARDRGQIHGWWPIFLPWWIHEEYEVQEWEPREEADIREFPDDFEKVALDEGIPFEGGKHQLSMGRLVWRRRVIVRDFGGPGKDATRSFQQEYPATAEEAFLMSGSMFFDEDAIRILSSSTSEPILRCRLVKDDTDRIVTQNSDRGFVRLYEFPDPAEHYVIGADTAEGKLVSAGIASNEADAEAGGRDYSAAVVLAVPTEDKPERVVAELHGRIAPEVFAEQLRLLGQHYGCGEVRQNAMLGVERGHSSGQTVLRLLREHYHYTPLYWAKEFNRRTKRVGRVLGWVTSAETRQPMLDELAMLLRRGAFLCSSASIVRELGAFIIWPDGKPAAQENSHDDRVIALAIAHAMIREHRHYETMKVKTYDYDEDNLSGM